MNEARPQPSGHGADKTAEEGAEQRCHYARGNVGWSQRRKRDDAVARFDGNGDEGRSKGAQGVAAQVGDTGGKGGSRGHGAGVCDTAVLKLLRQS